VAFAPAPAGGGIAPFQAAETGMTHPLPPGTRVRFSTSTMPNGTLVSLVKTLNQSELPYFATAQDDGTNLYQTLVQSGNADRLKQWAPYVVAI
jgi:aconitase B